MRTITAGQGDYYTTNYLQFFLFQRKLQIN